MAIFSDMVANLFYATHHITFEDEEVELIIFEPHITAGEQIELNK